ncbi:hypothetical protein CEQ90_10215 [Lewinellaceae bacterium SD302]|nr:hypothetical protein CEQ90_10215 [Lewinellaceae bacterium SD302]
MLKKLLRFQLIGLALIWAYVAISGYTMEPATFQVKATHAPVTATEELPIEQARPAEQAVESIPTKTFHPVSSNADLDAQLRFPVAGYDADAIISFYGDKRGKTRLHQGVDVKAPRHTPVVAVVDGFVEKIREGGSGGKVLYLRAGDGRLYYYAHLEDWSVEEFAAVREGQELGTVGDTGNAKGTTPHLHFEVLEGKKRQSIDPLPLLSTVVP